MLTANSPTHYFSRYASNGGPSKPSNAPPIGKSQCHMSEVSYINTFMKDYETPNDHRDEFRHHFDISPLDLLERNRFPYSNMDLSQDTMTFDLPLYLPSEYLGHDDMEIKNEHQYYESCSASSSQSPNYNEFDNVPSSYWNYSELDHISQSMVKSHSSEFPTPFTEHASLKLEKSPEASIASTINCAKPEHVMSGEYSRGQEMQIKNEFFGDRPGQPAKRRQVKNACVHCQKACKKCDESRPCHRCVKYGFADTCRDSVRKERKKGVKRGPYKRRIRDWNGLLVPTSKTSLASSSVLNTPRTRTPFPQKQTRQIEMYNRPKATFPQQEQSTEDDPEQKPKKFNSNTSFRQTDLHPLPPSTTRHQKHLECQHILPHPAKPAFPINHLSDASQYKEFAPYSSARTLPAAPAIDKPVTSLHSQIPTTSTAYHYVAAVAAVAAAANAPEPYRAAAAQYASAMSSPAPHLYQQTVLPPIFCSTSNPLDGIPATSSTSPESITNTKNRWNEVEAAEVKVEDCLYEHWPIQRILLQPPLPFFPASGSELGSSSYATSYLM